MFNNRKKITFLLQFVTILGFLALPYYLFGGKLFIGGDDSRLFYIFPWEWIHNIAFYSWFHFSAIGTNNPNQFILPFLYVWSFIGWIVQSKVILDYLSFSLPLILGFIYFQKMFGEIIEEKNNENKLVFYVGSLFYTLSPIIAFNQLSIFLYSVWLIGLIPLLLYYYLKYLKTDNFLYVFLSGLWSLLFSFTIGSVAWFLGFCISVFIALLIVIPYYSKKEIVFFVKKSIIFLGIFIFSQAIWIYPFAINVLFPEKNSFLGSVLSQRTSDTFTSTVLSTATGNIFYPMLNLFHRKLLFDYNSPFKDIFLSFYDKTIVFNSLFVILFFLALLNLKRYLNKKELRYYLFFFVSFLLSLFFFTANIGPLINIYLLMGHLPGFVMFRNFYDKFAFGYSLLYSIIFTFSLLILVRRFDKIKNFLIIGVLLVIFINVIPIKAVVNKVLWTTQDIYSVITLPEEYLDFIDQVQKTVPQTSNILSLPFNIAGYTIIKDKNNNNVFAGRSPVQLFTGINDFSGNLSFSPVDTDRFVNDLKKRDYKDLNDFFVLHNINYIFITKNIPNEVLHSYLFDKKVLNYQDEKFLKAITGKEILKSKKGSYILYTIKYSTSLFPSKNVIFNEVNPVTYKLTLKNLRSPQQLVFLDAFSGWWKLYPEALNSNSSSNELVYIFRKDIFSESHVPYKNYANQWTVDPNVIKQSLPKNYFHLNPDGSIDLNLTLYFKPQENFYIGIFISFVTLFLSLLYILYNKRRKK